MNEKRVSFELNEDMLVELANEYNPSGVAEKIKEKLADGQSIEKAVWTVGSRWGNRAVELGEQYPDRTYEVIREMVEQIGDYKPLLPQRAIEIAYLSMHGNYVLNVRENNNHRLVFDNPNCQMSEQIENIVGGSATACEGFCTVACKEIFKAYNINCDVLIEKKESNCRITCSY